MRKAKRSTRKNSHKYSEEAFTEIAGQGGWRVLDQASDKEDKFTVYTLQAV
ncbi:L-histidine N(alpha)-methyltransferase [Roseibium salinum]|nr:L-histidine N(alpha)-methyltransferase [Roseibium salinum]